MHAGTITSLRNSGANCAERRDYAVLAGPGRTEASLGAWNEAALPTVHAAIEPTTWTERLCRMREAHRVSSRREARRSSRSLLSFFQRHQERGEKKKRKRKRKGRLDDIFRISIRETFPYFDEVWKRSGKSFFTISIPNVELDPRVPLHSCFFLSFFFFFLVFKTGRVLVHFKKRRIRTREGFDTTWKSMEDKRWQRIKKPPSFSPFSPSEGDRTVWLLFVVRCALIAVIRHYFFWYWSSHRTVSLLPCRSSFENRVLLVGEPRRWRKSHFAEITHASLSCTPW